jgi:hypothetical protein
VFSDYILCAGICFRNVKYQEIHTVFSAVIHTSEEKDCFTPHETEKKQTRKPYAEHTAGSAEKAADAAGKREEGR